MAGREVVLHDHRRLRGAGAVRQRLGEVRVRRQQRRVAGARAAVVVGGDRPVRRIDGVQRRHRQAVEVQAAVGLGNEDAVDDQERRRVVLDVDGGIARGVEGAAALKDVGAHVDAAGLRADRIDVDVDGVLADRHRAVGIDETLRFHLGPDARDLPRVEGLQRGVGVAVEVELALGEGQLLGETGLDQLRA